MRLRHPLVLGSVLALAAAAPAAAAEVQVNAVETDPIRPAWDKVDVAIAAGDTVVWRFDGTTGFHNVMSGGGSWSYKSSPAATAAPPGSFKFDAEGTYVFVCEVHSTMRGTVVVGSPPPPPPPPPGSLPFLNDSAAPTVFETGGLDRTRPSLSDVSVRRAAGGARIRFRVSELSSVTVRLKRGGKTVKTKRVTASGRARMTIRDRGKLNAGRYRVVLVARDVAGNASSRRVAHLTLR